LKHSIILIKSIIILAVMLFSCQNDKQTIQQVSASEVLPGETTFEADLMYSDSARVQIRIIAPELNRFQGDEIKSIFPKGIELRVYDKEEKIVTTLTAEYGEHYETQKKLDVKNNVVVVNGEGDTLYTEHLIWDEVNHTIESDEYVKIRTGEEIIYGEGLEAKEDFSSYRIKKIKGTIVIKEEKDEQVQ